jgi:hypothetical protein
VSAFSKVISALELYERQAAGKAAAASKH